MKEYNSAFFGLYEIWFKVLKSELDEEKALMLFKTVMETMLENAYGKNFDKGQPLEFIRLVSQRDENVGVKVSFHEITDNSFIYRFHTDVFPNLKGYVNSEKLSATYIHFKVRYLLGENWTFKTLAHIWDGDEYTDFLIYQNAN